MMDDIVKFFKVALLASCTVLIGYLSLVDDSVDDPPPVPDLNSYGIEHLDKLAHFAAYGLLICSALWLFSSRKGVILSCLAIAVYSLLLELAQTLVPLREPSINDFLANITGIVFGVLFMRTTNLVTKNSQLDDV
ncbi:VanZ family protein [Vibrio sp. TH_r3]|uniref:VanZ family protein n=1 Tax=Vibrio sp. TH_r3 TaxID=3082084 RepID=UPI002952BFC8|nr:VanZ family protein [Vibrio sp. TH_r3]MDV7102915.1 VanZ family protein [Vibrio sp. TH_r3]